MKACFPLLYTLPLLLASCSFVEEQDGSAHVTRMAAAPACLPATAPGAQHAGSRVPADYGEFICMPSYPRTFGVWMDRAQLDAAGPRRVEIDLARQRGLFLVDDKVAMDFPVCTGTKRKPTPTGSFRISQKDIDHVSNIYDVPMPYFMRLTDYGIGLHVGDVFRTPASHGCIRLPREACEPLYHRAPSGTRVLIRRSGWQKSTQQAVNLAAGLTPPERG